MSHFSVALNAVLERLKETSGTTRVDFANRVGIPRSTLSAYATEKFSPDAAALEKLVAGLEEDAALQIVKAHLLDSVPAPWRDKVRLTDEPLNSSPLEGYNLPPNFVRHIELILGEARSNPHIIAFVEEFVGLLGLDRTPPDDSPTSFLSRKIPLEPPQNTPPSPSSSPSPRLSPKKTTPKK